MAYTKGEWKVRAHTYHAAALNRFIIEANGNGIAEANNKADAQLISAAPLGHELAEFVARISATWIEEGLLEIGEGDYTHMKKLALNFLAKAEGK